MQNHTTAKEQSVQLKGNTALIPKNLQQQVEAQPEDYRNQKNTGGRGRILMKNPQHKTSKILQGRVIFHLDTWKEENQQEGERKNNQKITKV